jgi:hypothetical protein
MLPLNNLICPHKVPLKMNAAAPIFEPMKMQSPQVEVEKAHALMETLVKLLEQENAILRVKAQGLVTTGGPASGFPVVPPGANLWPGMSPWAVPPGKPWLRTDMSDAESTIAPADSCQGLGSDSEDFECIGPPPGLGEPHHFKTTIMMRNIPMEYTRSMLLALLDEQGFSKYCYDMLYLPINFRSGRSLGYSFINFVSHAEAERFEDHFRAFKDWAIPSEQVCEVDWSSTHQGLSVHVARYQNSPVMHESVPDEHKPILFENGERVQFPAPTKMVRAPKGRNVH